MVQTETRLKVADNSGARSNLTMKFLVVQDVSLLTSGDVIVASCKTATPGGAVKR